MTQLIPKDDRGIEPCLALYLRKANRVITQIYDHNMSQHGIKVTQFSILRAVNYMGEATNGTLQEALVIDQTTLSRNLKPLIRDGYLQVMSGEDKRQKLIRLTDNGKRLFMAARKDWNRSQQAIAKELGEDMTQQLLTVSDRVVELKV
ncbi:MAG: MarR family transcriptional regulator [Cellvibrionaceae bacterium]|nr:MarR family transcriptional regulator [Cellvibrionaceae bacterium]|tara:strand:+ start:35772 stop:36215 length:444 start_codon:yes stop_codon:yes gene_type:complete